MGFRGRDKSFPLLFAGTNPLVVLARSASGSSWIVGSAAEGGRLFTRVGCDDQPYFWCSFVLSSSVCWHPLLSSGSLDYPFPRVEDRMNRDASLVLAWHDGRVDRCKEMYVVLPFLPWHSRPALPNREVVSAYRDSFGVSPSFHGRRPC